MDDHHVQILAEKYKMKIITGMSNFKLWELHSCEHFLNCLFAIFDQMRH